MPSRHPWGALRDTKVLYQDFNKAREECLAVFKGAFRPAHPRAPPEQRWQKGAKLLPASTPTEHLK